MAAVLLMAGNLSLQAQNVSFNNERLSLKKAFEKIEKASNYKIAYNASKLNVNETVLLNLKNKTVPQVMEVLLKNTDYTFEVKGNQIVIVQKKQEKQNTNSQKIKVKGVVTDQNGESVIGASIVEKAQETEQSLTLRAATNSVFLPTLRFR